MTRSLRYLVAAAAALAATVGAAVALMQPGAPAPRVVAVAAAAQPANGWSHDDGDASYDLERLAYVSNAIVSVKDNYVDKSRIDPKGMVVAALDAVEKTVAEVMVEGDATSGKLDVTVGAEKRSFDLQGVTTLWDVHPKLVEVMGFVKQHLVAHKDLREIEFAAANGLLQTLDPHSILLDPKMFREMRVQTKGEFGGLGFVIGMREGNLTVMRVLKNTPASRAGIKAKDVIARIDDQSTVNMDVQEAVDLIRGKPGTRVQLTVQRAAWPSPKQLAVQREIVAVETVPQFKLLEGGIGYVKVSQFSANTTRDLVSAITQERAEAGGKLQGLVLDLRNNPGGLLEQAVAVSDLFLSQGVIVKTVSEGDQQSARNEVKEAARDRDDLSSVPLVVIVNNGSASASEIVAGALKNNDRALVIGRQTFGKGSVQVLYDLSEPGKGMEEQSALKLTIAQYLTPGDLSIQEVGVTPDVLLLPGRALKDAVNHFAPPRMMGEADLDRHFSNPASPAVAAEAAKRAKEREERREKAALELRYLLPEAEDAVAKAMAADEKRAAQEVHAAAGMDVDQLTPEQIEDEDADADPDAVKEDYQIRFARELLVRSPFPDRKRLIEGARTLVTEKQVDEERRFSEKMRTLGVDWTGGAANGTPRARVTVTPPTGQRIAAGETLPWTVTVENTGNGTFRRLRAWTRVEKNPLLDRREFVFGTVKPGQKRSWTVPVKVPKGLDSRHDEVKLQFDEANGNAPPEVATALDIVEIQKPIFAFSSQIQDAQGNGDGLVQRGERISLRVDVRNEGKGAAGDKTYVSVKNLGDEKTSIEKGRVVIGALAPGETKSATLTLDVRAGGEDKVPLRIMVVDEKLDEWMSERLEVPVRPPVARAPAPAPAVRVKVAQALLRSGAAADAPAVASAKQGAVLTATARVGDFVRVEWDKKSPRSGFVAAADVEPTPAAATPSGKVELAWQREPPRIELQPDPAKGAPVVTSDRLRLQGAAFVPNGVPGAKTRLRDVFVFVNDQKVFFKVVPENGGPTRLEFSTDLPLEPGNNTVTVFAREDEEFQTRRTIQVHRGSAGEVAQGRP